MSKKSGKTEKSLAVNKTSFTPADTRFIKGFAILLLMWHHLTISPDNYYRGTTFPLKFMVFGKNLGLWFANVGNISVTIFAFLGGYALAKCYSKPHFFSDKIWSLYKNYWKVFFVFVPIGFLFFSNQQQFSDAEYVLNNFREFDFSGFIYNLVGLSTTYNSEWWFFMMYIKAVFLGLIFIHLNRNKKSYYVEIAELLLFVMVFSFFSSLSDRNENFSFIKDISIFTDFFSMTRVTALLIMGTVFGKYDLLPSLINHLHRYPLLWRKLISFVVIVLILVQRKTYSIDYILVPLLVVSLYELFGYYGLIRKVMGFVGTHSSNMYYMHTFLIFYFGATARIIYKPDNSFISFLVFVAMCLVISVVINKFYDLLAFVVGKTGLLKDRFSEEKAEISHDKAADNKVSAESAPQSRQETFSDVMTVDNYSDPINCIKCNKELVMGKMFCVCHDCGIYYIRNKYMNDDAISDIVSQNSVVWVKKDK